MRDFKAGRDINVDGDVIITDQSHQTYKPLTQCTNDELMAERNHRQKLLDDEKSRKKTQILNLVIFAAVVVAVISIWNFIAGKSNLAMYLIGFVGILLPVSVALRISNQQTEFEIRQIQALKEIYYLLIERGEE